MKRAPTELRFFKSVDEPSEAEKAIRFLAYASLAAASLMLIVWGCCLAWGPKL